MNLRIEIDPSLQEPEVIIKCSEITEEILELQKKISTAKASSLQLEVSKADTLYYLNVSDLIFVETAGEKVAVHTRDGIYETKQRLYELEELLPGNFIRVSKSTILNVDLIHAIHKNITGASEVEFIGSAKKAFVSRSYYKLLTEKLEEKRLKK